MTRTETLCWMWIKSRSNYSNWRNSSKKRNPNFWSLNLTYYAKKTTSISLPLQIHPNRKPFLWSSRPWASQWLKWLTKTKSCWEKSLNLMRNSGETRKCCSRRIKWLRRNRTNWYSFTSVSLTSKASCRICWRPGRRNSSRRRTSPKSWDSKKLSFSTPRKTRWPERSRYSSNCNPNSRWWGL